MEHYSSHIFLNTFSSNNKLLWLNWLCWIWSPHSLNHQTWKPPFATMVQTHSGHGRSISLPLPLSPSLAPALISTGNLSPSSAIDWYPTHTSNQWDQLLVTAGSNRVGHRDLTLPGEGIMEGSVSVDLPLNGNMETSVDHQWCFFLYLLYCAV